MLSSIVSSLIIIVEIIFGILAIFTQKASLNSKNDYSIIVHGIAWAVETLVIVSSFFILALFSTEAFAIASFVIGIILLIIGFFAIYTHVKL